MANADKESKAETLLPDEHTRKKRKEAGMIYAELSPIKSFIESIQNTTLEGSRSVHLSTDLNDIDSRDMGSPNLLWIASSKGKKEVVDLLIKSKRVNIDQPDENGFTPLMEACQNGHMDVVMALLDANAKTDHAENAHGWTALHIAARGGHAEIMEALVKPNEDILNKKTKTEGSTALYIAAAQGGCKAVEELLKLKADVKLVNDIKGFTVLHAAANGGHSDTLNTLLQNEVLKSMINEPDTKWKRTPLLLASWKGSIQCVQILCNLKADVSKQTTGGYTPMHWAAALGHTDVIKILYKAKADITALNKAEETPIDLAKRGHRNSAVKLLNDYAAKQAELFSATRDGNITEMKSLLESVENINFGCRLYDNPTGFEVLKCDHGEIMRTLKDDRLLRKYNWKDIALLLASYEGNVSKVSYLLDNKANIDTCTKQGWTPLMIASENGKELVVQHLLLRGANVNAVTKWNQSALLFAAWGNYVKILEILICSHADVNVTTEGGWTAYQWTLTLDHSESEELLKHTPGSQMKQNDKSKDSNDDLLHRNETRLDMDDHSRVFEETKKASQHWREIGRQFNFSMDELDSITFQPGRTTGKDFYEAMLGRWMNRKNVTAEQLSLALNSAGCERIAFDFLKKMKILKRMPSYFRGNSCGN